MDGSHTDSSLIVQNWQCPKEGFRVPTKNLFFIFLMISSYKVDLFKNISPLLVFIPKSHLFSIKMPPPLCVLFHTSISYTVMLRNETSRNIAILKNKLTQIILAYSSCTFGAE